MTDALEESYDVAVIGAGPAGLAAAALCADAGLATVLFDEQPGPGGQIYRAIMSTPLYRGAILGDDYWRGAKLAAECAAAGADYVADAAVWSLAPARGSGEHEIGVSAARA